VLRTRTHALVLRCVDYGEADRIVHLLTPDAGRVTAIAKSARKSVKRFPGSLDVFNELDLELRRRRPQGMAYLEQAKLVDPHLGLRTSPRRYALACFVLELLDRLTPEGGASSEMETIFVRAREVLAEIEQGEPDLALRLLLELRLLDALGLRPQLEACVRCGRALDDTGSVGFHVADGGAICGACGLGSDGILGVHLGTLRALGRGLAASPGQVGRIGFGREALREAAQLVFRFHRFHVGLEIRRERFLAEIYSTP